MEDNGLVDLQHLHATRGEVAVRSDASVDDVEPVGE